MKVYDLLVPDEVEDMIQQGLVRVRHHPDMKGYRILNYTEQAAFSNSWNDVTRTCRGLILDEEDNIIARPFPKFMNYGQVGADPIGMHEPVQVTDKMDGSLGILYCGPNGFAIATRGSFESEQAIHATALFLERYWSFVPNPHLTYLFEIVYPSNRIVLNYGDMDDLVLLGVVENETGDIFGPNGTSWPGPTTEVFEYSTLFEALQAPSRPNAEGLVVRAGNRMLKIKQEDYVALHRIVTGLSEKTVWEAIANGTYSELIEKVPDEFFPWVDDVACKLIDRHFDIAQTVQDEFREIEDRLFDLGLDLSNRREFAGLAMQSPSHIRPMLFKNLDGQQYTDIIWKLLKPVGFSPMKAVSEDAS